jgi:hypothetical protein
MAKALADKNLNGFWNKVSNLKNTKVPLPGSVDECQGEKDISKMWKCHYESIMNCVRSDDHKEDVLHSFQSISDSDNIVIVPGQVLSALKSAKQGKSPGQDGLSSEHFIFADDSLSVCLALLFSSMLTHGFLPVEFMSSAIIPIIKNKTGDSKDKGNYRPVAIVTACSKIFEHILLNLIDDCLRTCDNQFGFKAKHSTDLCIFTLKSVIEYYKRHKSPVFSCFLDASKAFDRVNHWTLFKKLSDRNIPILIIRILCCWYREQSVYIRWGDCMSDGFKVTNGVRQGSILSPKIFAIYVDQLSVRLIESKVGCFIDNVCFNHLFYADDLCLLAPSAIALQKLINICNIYGIEHDILYNPLKSICMVFKPNRYRLHCPPVHIGSEQVEYRQSVKYLGVLLKTDLQDNDEMLKHVRGLYARCNTVLRKFASCSPSIKLHLFQTYCSSFYCAHLWSNY